MPRVWSMRNRSSSPVHTSSTVRGVPSSPMSTSPMAMSCDILISAVPFAFQRRTGVSTPKQPSILWMSAAHLGQGLVSRASSSAVATLAGSHSWCACRSSPLISWHRLHTNTLHTPHFQAVLRNPRQPSAGQARTNCRRSVADDAPAPRYELALTLRSRERRWCISRPSDRMAACSARSSSSWACSWRSMVRAVR